MKKSALFLVAMTILPLTVSSGTAHAMGENPAFHRNDNTAEQTAKLQDSIMSDVHKELSDYLPYADATYKKTDLFSVLKTNYGNKGYPSQVKTEDGYNKNGVLMMNALKQPISQPKQIALADYVRYYYYSFTPEIKFQALSDNSGVASVDGDDEDQKNNKLNYFDYISLINTIKDNPNFSREQRDQKLIEVENDLQTSIDTLYGEGVKENAPSTDLAAWGDDKDVSIPFSSSIYSYVQLLASYKKSQSIEDTLSFYSSILDTLSSIKSYSVSIRQGNRNATIDVKALQNNISSKYKTVDKSLVQPMIQVVKDQSDSENNAEKAAQWQTNQLGHLGLTNRDK